MDSENGSGRRRENNAEGKERAVKISQEEREKSLEGTINNLQDQTGKETITVWSEPEEESENGE